MLLTNFLEKIGEYTLLMQKVFTKPQKWNVFLRQYINEISKLGVDSIWIVILYPSLSVRLS